MLIPEDRLRGYFLADYSSPKLHNPDRQQEREIERARQELIKVIDFVCDMNYYDEKRKNRGDRYMWQEINTNEDIKAFMEAMCCFHDSCIKEMHYISGAYVGEGLGMYPLNDKRVLRVIIQRQFDDPSMLEMEFSGLKNMNLYPVGTGYTCEILGSTMFEKDGFIYWCDDEIDSASIEDYDGTLICAEKLRWRPITGHMGAKEYYLPKE